MNTWFLRGIKDQVLEYENEIKNENENKNENKNGVTGKRLME